MQEQIAGVEKARVEKSGADRRGGKCRSGKCGSRLAVWKAEPILYSETALSYFLKIVSRLLSEERVIFIAFLNSGGLSFL